MTTSQPKVVVENLNVDFALGNSIFKSQKMRAVSEVSFELRKGEALALVGESGSGKSTCARVLVQLAQASSGAITVDGHDLMAKKASNRMEYARKIQMIFQDPFGSLNPVHSIRHHLARPIKIHSPDLTDEEVSQKVEQLLERVGLTPVSESADKYPHEMSGGQKQRVAIARVLAVGAEVILADEPISMLDVSIRLGILNLMDDMKKNENIAFLYITHDIATASYFAERTAVMYVGHMVEWGDSKSVTCSPRHPYTKLLIDSIPSIDKEHSEAKHSKNEIPLWTPESTGCPFASRCPAVLPICSETLPGARKVADNHFVRCHADT